ncbi:hypothetical protein LIA77_09604 [Sarocladium implicatum]|nr:hypothetical protein LIA77_09604 [Sarocladium implicatum]
MAPSTRSRKKPEVVKDPYEFPEKSPDKVATRSSGRAQLAQRSEAEPPRLRMSNRRAGVRLNMPDSTAATTRKRKRAQPEPPQAGSDDHDDDGEEEEPEERNSPAPTPAFIRDINEGIRGSPSTAEAQPIPRPTRRQRNARPRSSGLAAPTEPTTVAEDAEDNAAPVQQQRRRGRGRPKKKSPVAHTGRGIEPHADASEAQEPQAAPELAEAEDYEEETDVVPAEPTASIAEVKQPQVKITADRLAHLEATIARSSWTGRKKDCHLLLKGKPETEEEWLNRMEEAISSRGTSLVKRIGQLIAIIKEAPRGFNLINEQTSYLSEYSGDIDDLFLTMQHETYQLTSAMEPAGSENARRKSAAAVRDTRTVYIPLLVFALRDTFRLGGGCGEGGEIHPSTQGTFTHMTLSLASLLIQLATALWEALKASYIATGDDTKHLQGLYDQLSGFERNVAWGLKIVEERDPERLRRAKEQDEAVKLEVNARRQEDINERDRKLAAFVASTQRMRQQLSASRGSNHHEGISLPDSDSDSDMDESFELVSEGGLSRDTVEEEEELARAQLEQERIAEMERQEQRKKEEALRRQKEWYMEKDREAREQREAVLRARREHYERRFAAFAASTQHMKAG